MNEAATMNAEVVSSRCDGTRAIWNCDVRLSACSRLLGRTVRHGCFPQSLAPRPAADDRDVDYRSGHTQSVVQASQNRDVGQVQGAIIGHRSAGNCHCLL